MLSWAWHTMDYLGFLNGEEKMAPWSSKIVLPPLLSQSQDIETGHWASQATVKGREGKI